MVVAGALGLLAAMVLTIDRFRLLEDPSTQLACNLSPFIACGPVMQSKAGALFGFPNPLLGIIGFSVVLTTGVLRSAGAALPRWYHRGLQVGVLAAAVFITWLQTQSLYVIGALCLWCMLVWTVTIPLVVVVTLENAATGRLGAGPPARGHPPAPVRGHGRRRSGTSSSWPRSGCASTASSPCSGSASRSSDGQRVLLRLKNPLPRPGGGR